MLERVRTNAARARESGLVALALESQLLVGEMARDEGLAREVRAEVRTEATAIGFERLAGSAREGPVAVDSTR